MVPDKDHELYLPMTDNQINDVIEYGVFPFWLMGHIFYLGVRPFVFNIKMNAYLQKEAENVLIPAHGNERIFEMIDIRQIDCLMMRFNH